MCIMCELKNFRRNITCFEGYDENSFIGKWYDDGVWDDTKGYCDWNRYHY